MKHHIRGQCHDELGISLGLTAESGLKLSCCPGYVIDHIKPLTCDGADDPSNMQWQTKAESKAKDKWERKGCKTDSSGSHSYSGSRSTGSGSYQTGPKEAALPIQPTVLKNMWRIRIVGIDIHNNCG